VKTATKIREPRGRVHEESPPREGRPRRARRQARRELTPARILGIGSYVPEGLLKNSDLERMVATSDEWILTRTGIRERRIVAPGQSTSDLAIEAARKALDRARLDAGDVELIVVATATPDQVTPATACHVQHGLGARRAAGFDLNAACSGFINALMTGHNLIASGAFANALVIGADSLSTITDYQDRESCVLFGDGAGAVVLGASEGEGELLDHVVHMDGGGAGLIAIPAGGSREPTSHATVDRRAHYLALEGREVFRFAVKKIGEVVAEMLDRHGLSVDDIGLLVPHQANRRILDAAVRSLGLDPSRVVVNIERYGNTSNASIPLALDEAELTGRLERGRLVLLVAFGGGLTWGASLLRW
jgi:3-oxoacyl-[acyl-carrier-protein] synthase-3